MSRYQRKYAKGSQIRTLGALIKEIETRRFVFLGHKVYHHGWLRSMPYDALRRFVLQGRAYRAKLTPAGRKARRKDGES